MTKLVNKVYSFRNRKSRTLWHSVGNQIRWMKMYFEIFEQAITSRLGVNTDV